MNNSIFMAIVKNGILGPGSGKVGPVVMVQRNGKSYLRAVETSRKDPNTEAQQKQRDFYKDVVDFLTPIRNYIEKGIVSYDKSVTSYNVALSQIIKEAFVETDESKNIDYSKVEVSKGSLIGVENVSATCDGGKMTFNWHDDSSAEEGISATDTVMPMVYNIDKKRAVFKLGKFKRSDSSAVLDIPAHWSGDKVVAYVGVRDEKAKRCSDSIYLGEYVVD